MSSCSKATRCVVAMVVATAACSTDTQSVTDPLKNPPSVVFTRGGVPAHQAAQALQAVAAGTTQAVAAAPALAPPGAPVPPFIEARLYAIASIAMHDALNAIVPRFERYADTGPLDAEAGIAAAVLTAARDAIAGASPAAAAATNAWYTAAIASYEGGAGYAAGVTLGQRAAAAILALRAADGTAGGGVAPYVPGTVSGDYQFTFPFNTPQFDFFGTGGFADGSVWGATVTPFVVASTSQFRAPPPYGAGSNAAAVQTAAYTADFNEVKALGCSACGARTPVQTEIGLFWVENSPTGWYRVAQTVAENRSLDAWDTARLLALVQMGEFDAYATNLESKYHYDFWRPVTAVALAGTDGNPDTDAAGGWDVLAFPTPPVPDYPSAHAAAGGAAAAIIEDLLPGRGRPIELSSTTLPGVTRRFGSVSEAAMENALSRIYVGFHFRHAVDVGLTQGRGVGAYIALHALRPLQ